MNIARTVYRLKTTSISPIFSAIIVLLGASSVFLFSLEESVVMLLHSRWQISLSLLERPQRWR